VSPVKVNEGAEAVPPENSMLADLPSIN